MYVRTVIRGIVGPPSQEPSAEGTLETFPREGRAAVRQFVDRPRSTHARATVDDWTGLGVLDADTAEARYLRSSERPDLGHATARTLRAVDLFAGCGGISLGVAEACRSLGLAFEAALAVDFDAPALEVYGKNFVGSRTENADVTEFFNGTFRARTTRDERALIRSLGDVDLLAGGPPCQGHSDLNNRTRWLDPKNELYFSMVRAAEILEPECVLIENVPGAIRDRGRVVQRTIDALVALGYAVDSGVVDASTIGVPQSRRRLFVLGSKRSHPDVASIESTFARRVRSVRWAIDDLTSEEATGPFTEPCASAPETRSRIDYLFDNNLYDLPDSERPSCHRNKKHTYSSIYGRLRWDEPAQTITTGFYSMCMGRYVHPELRRTITAHEAARLQYFPDHFDFSSVTHRGELARMIGNAVPSRLGYAAALELLR
jgi:DNA (cytosine-5)-methyltransferase 1